MVVNFPGPYEVRIFYSVDATPGGVKVHQMRLNCQIDGTPDPGTTFPQMDLVKRDSGTLALSTAVDLLVTKIVPFYDVVDASIDYAELWKYEAGKFDSSFVSAYSIGEAGTHVGDVQPAGEVITTFRTAEGGIMKNVMLDSNQTVGVQIPYADLAPPFDAYADHFTLAGPGYWLARDTSWPITCIYMFPGQNEHLFKSRFRG